MNILTIRDPGSTAGPAFLGDFCSSATASRKARRSPQQPREPGVLDRKTGSAVAKRS